MQQFKLTPLIITTLILTACGNQPELDSSIKASIRHNTTIPDMEIIEIEGEAGSDWFSEKTLPVQVFDNKGQVIGTEEKFLEASFPIEVYDANGEFFAKSMGIAQGDWKTEVVVPFSSEIIFEQPKTEAGTIIFYKANPSNSSEDKDRFEMPVEFQSVKKEEVSTIQKTFETCSSKVSPLENHSDIKNISVKEGDLIKSPLTITGEARSFWFFEGDAPVLIYDDNGNKLGSGLAQGHSYELEKFVPLNAEIEFDTPETETGILVLCRENVSSNENLDDSIQIPIRFETFEANKEVSYQVEEYTSKLEIPWGIAFTSEDRMLITERSGRIKVIENGRLQSEPLHTFSEVSTTGEEGLMSVEIDPDYQWNDWLYFSYAYMKGDEMKVKVVRFTDAGDKLEDETIIIDDLPAARFHAGSRLAFGPDGKLYITVGDALERKNAQDLNSLAGKLLRLNKSGSIPEDNPFTDSPIWSYGHRNSQGIDWHPETGELYSSEHGPSVFDGPAGGDEINRIIKGGNYGWPLVSHDEKMEGMIPPIIQFTPAEPPGSLIVYSGKLFPQFKNNIFVGSLKGEGLIRVVLDENNPDKVLSYEKLFEGKYGRIRTVVEGPDGSIYFTTSNQDGRGDAHEGDDRIFRITRS